MPTWCASQVALSGEAMKKPPTAKSSPSTIEEAPRARAERRQVEEKEPDHQRQERIARGAHETPAKRYL